LPRKLLVTVEKESPEIFDSLKDGKPDNIFVQAVVFCPLFCLKHLFLVFYLLDLKNLGIVTANFFMFLMSLSSFGDTEKFLEE